MAFPSILEGAPFGATWLEDGTIIYSRGAEGLRRIRDDGGDSEVVNYDVSNNGMLAYLEVGATAEKEPVWVDRKGHEEPIAVAAGVYQSPRLSPDGRRAVFMAADSKASTHLLVLEFLRDVFVPLANTEAPEVTPVWLPDGKRVAYVIPAVGLFLEAADGTGARETVSSPNIGWPQVATADGKELVLTSVGGYLRTNANGHGGIGVRALESGTPPRLMSVAVESGDVLTLGQPQTVMDWPDPVEQTYSERTYDVDPSGQRFLALKPVPVALRNVKLSQLHIVQNWFSELKRLVPTEPR